MTWFPGQEFDNALADVLLGDREPGGRLPTVWPAAEHDHLPSTRPVDGRLSYQESIHVGNRAYDRARPNRRSPSATAWATAPGTTSTSPRPRAWTRPATP